MYFSFKLGWAVIFKKDGLDIDGMTEYLNSVSGTTVTQTEECDCTVVNSETGEEEEVPCVMFVMETDGFLIPTKFFLELHLRHAFTEEDIQQNSDLKNIYVALGGGL